MGLAAEILKKLQKVKEYEQWSALLLDSFVIL